MLNAVLERLSRDQITLEEAGREIVRIAREESASATDTLKALRSAFDQGKLGEERYNHLCATVQEALQDRGDAREEAEASAEDDDATVPLAPGETSVAPEDTEAPPDDVNSDVTVLAPQSGDPESGQDSRSSEAGDSESLDLDVGTGPGDVDSDETVIATRPEQPASGGSQTPNDNGSIDLDVGSEPGDVDSEETTIATRPEPPAGQGSQAPNDDGSVDLDVDAEPDDAYSEKTALATQNDQPAGEEDGTVADADSGNRSGSDAESGTGSGTGSGSSAWSSGTSSSRRSWTPPGGESTPELKGLGPGSFIKDRFVLEKVLGSGGMGKVYQARDQLKVEARDRNPHVALKVLTEDFKEHPEAFIALQREASRQQRLAHPNIATVYDFDRIGRTGTQVFITMELMEGYPLNTYIKRIVRPRGGLPPEEALPLIAQLGAALAYAHKRDIVHSDFKPGNAFLCDDGTLKVLDFGIARAVKAPGGGAGAGEHVEGDGEQHTYFDPGQLGALTPAYASLEMLNGEPPDPRDDIYALACVAHELLTGHHPFARKSAAKAQAEGLTVKPIKSLKRRQMRGLLKGLAFERKDRSPDVETFVEQVEGRLNWHKNPYVIGGALAAALAIAGIGPALDWLEQRRIDRLVTEIRNSDPGRIENILDSLDTLDPSARNTVTEEARDSLQAHFELRVHNAVDPAAGRYDFDKAEAELERAQALYPDSAAMIDLADFIESARDRRLHELNQQLLGALEQERLLPAQGSNEQPAVPTVLQNIRRIAPEHGLLEDPRIPNTYASAAQGAINTGDLERAEDLLSTGETLAPDAIDLLNTRARLETARDNRQRSARVEELRTRFDDEVETMTNLAAFREAESAIVELARLAPSAPLLSALRNAAQPIARDRLSELDERGQYEEFVAANESVLEALDLHDLIVEARLAGLDDAARTDERRAIIESAEQGLAAALSEPAFDRAWEAELRNHLRYLEAALPDDATDKLAEARADIAEVYTARASELEQDQIYAQALDLLERARALGLESSAIEQAYARIDEAQTQFLREREEAARQARLQGLKETLLIQARARELDAATDTFDELDAELPEDDPFLTITAPNALGDAFEEVARARADEDNYKAALEIAQRGREYAPDDQSLNEARQDYTVEVNIDKLRRLFKSENDFDTSRAAKMVDEIRTWAPALYSQVETEFVNTLAERIRKLANEDRAKAERLATRANNIFPASARLAELREKVAPRPWPEGSAGRAALAAGRLTEAEAILERGRKNRPDHPEVANLAENLAARKDEAEAAFARYKQALEAGELAEARGHLADARSLWVDNRDYRTAQAELSERVANKRRQQSRILQRSQDIEGLRAAAETSGREIVQEDWEPVPSPRPCTPRLAGYGPRARAICYDLIHNRVRGPLMVVVPGDEEQDAFAISKYEISIEDYNKYCFLSGNCTVDDSSNEDLPMTGISLEAIREYTEWLSQRTGKTYRLPRLDEWQYAAEAGGEQPPRDFNCRVTLGDQVLKGTNLIDVSVGHQNGWGLKNYIGNAQEIVVKNGSIVARGGAYRDPHAECSAELERAADEQGNAITGFRLILEDLESLE